MADIYKTIFSYTFSWMKMCEFRLKFHGTMFAFFNYWSTSVGSDKCLTLNRLHAIIIWTNHGLICRRIQASPGFNVLILMPNQSDRHFADESHTWMFKYIFLNDLISIFACSFGPPSQCDNKPVWLMAWPRTGDKPFITWSNVDKVPRATQYGRNE